MMNFVPMYSMDPTYCSKEFATTTPTHLYHIPQISLPQQPSQSVVPQEFQVFSVQDYLTMAYHPQLPTFVNPYTTIPQNQEPQHPPVLTNPQVPLIPTIQTSVASGSQQPVSPRQPSSPHTPRSPRISPRKTDHTNDFGRRFQALIHNNQKANQQWRKFRNDNKSQCTIKRCIRLRLAFCEKYGQEFSSLITSKCFRGLGTRSNCRCAISSQSSTNDQSPPSPMSMSPPSPHARDNIGSPMMACSSPPSTISFQSSWTPSSPPPQIPDHQAKVIALLEQLSGRRSMGLPVSDKNLFCTDF